MGYIEKSLATNEHLIYRAQFHWLYDLAAWVLLLGALVGAFVLNGNDYPAWASLSLVALGVLFFLSIKLPLWAQQIAVTDQRLIHRRGLVGRDTEELQLRSVEEVRLDQGILGRIFGFGRIVVSGTGIEDLRLPTLAEPMKLRRKLQEAISAATSRPIAA